MRYTPTHAEEAAPRIVVAIATAATSSNRTRSSSFIRASARKASGFVAHAWAVANVVPIYSGVERSL